MVSWWSGVDGYISVCPRTSKAHLLAGIELRWVPTRTTRHYGMVIQELDRGAEPGLALSADLLRLSFDRHVTASSVFRLQAQREQVLR